VHSEKHNNQQSIEYPGHADGEQREDLQQAFKQCMQPMVFHARSGELNTRIVQGVLVEACPPAAKQRGWLYPVVHTWWDQPHTHNI
jgi:hypothetical protein